MILELIQKNKIEQILDFLEKDELDLFAKDNDGYTPLHTASLLNKIDIVRLFLKYPLDINSKNKFDNTSLHIAIEEGHYDIVKILIEKSADVNIKGGDDFSPLHTAVSSKHTDIIKLLLENNAHINSVDNDGNTPLWTAVMRYHNDDTVIKTLLSFEADPTIENNHGISLFKLLNMPKNKGIKELFKEKK